MKNLLLICASVFLAASLSPAREQRQDEPKTGKTETIQIAVKSIQCGMCKKVVESALKAVDGVKKTQVDLETKVATVTFLPAKTNLAALETVITQTGYSANAKEPDAEAYEKLDDCCKLPQE